MAVLRPVLFRSEFVSRGTLRAFQQNSMKDGFDVFGFPKFQNIYIKRDLLFYETKLAQTRYYARYLNREFKQYIIAHPDKFSVQTIKLYKAGYTSKNPVTVDGIVVDNRPQDSQFPIVHLHLTASSLPGC